MEDLTNYNKKRLRGESAYAESDLEFQLPEVKRLKDDLLSGFLDDSDPDPPNLDLDSVMKSFEVEISASSSSPVHVVDLTSSDSKPDLGYLLEASDDELGLPPSGSVSNEDAKSDEVSELARLSSDSSGIGELWEFEDHIPSYESFELGIGEVNNLNEFVAFDVCDGLFEYSNVYFDSTQISELPWRHETVPAE